GRRRGLKHLGIAILAGALVCAGDWASGEHLLVALGSFADRLGAWYESRRLPAYPCAPYDPKTYAAVEGVEFEVPACWEVKVVSLLGRDVHRFQDPDARAGIVSVIVEPASSQEESDELTAEFERLAANPGAIVDGVENRAEEEE